jgi:hypothetical protein
VLPALKSMFARADREDGTLHLMWWTAPAPGIEVP